MTSQDGYLSGLFRIVAGWRFVLVAPLKVETRVRIPLGLPAKKMLSTTLGQGSFRLTPSVLRHWFLDSPRPHRPHPAPSPGALILKKVARTYPRRKLHVVVDNYRTHKHPDVQEWLALHPRITLHFTPTSGSWMNLVEVFFSIITRQAIRRGTFRSVKELVGAIIRFIEGWNDRCAPFVWTKTADQILPHAVRQGISDARH
jgi:transposase